MMSNLSDSGKAKTPCATPARRPNHPPTIILVDTADRGMACILRQGELIPLIRGIKYRQILVLSASIRHPLELIHWNITLLSIQDSSTGTPRHVAPCLQTRGSAFIPAKGVCLYTMTVTGTA